MSQSTLRAERTSLSLRLLAGQAAAYAPATVVPAFIGLLSSAIFTRVFSPAGYGEYSLTISVATLATAVAAQWVQQAVNRYLPAARETEEKVHIKQALVAALVVVETAVLLVGLTVTIVSREYTFTLPGLAFVALSVVYGPTGVVLQAEMLGQRYSMFHVLNSALKLLFSLALVLIIRPHPSLLIWGAVLSFAVLVPFVWYNAGIPPALRAATVVDPATQSLLRKFANYGLPMAGWFLASSLLSVGDRYVIQWFRGSAEVGIYSANYQLISGAIGLVTAPVLLAAHPFLMRAWGEGDVRETAGWLGTILELLAILGVTVVALTTLFSADLARWFLGPEFRIGHVVMPLVLAGVVSWNVAMYLHKPLEFSERTRMMLVLGLAAAALNVFLNIAFVPQYGYVAAAWTTLASYAAYGIVVGVAGWRSVRWRVRWSILLQVVVWAVALVFAGAWVRQAGSMAMGYWGGVAGAMGVVALFGLGLVALLWKPIVLPLIRRARNAADR